MTYTRRSFIAGAGSGLSLLILTACTDSTPIPSGSPTPSSTGTSPVPRPVAFTRSSWSTDPFSRGSHSYIPAGSSPGLRSDLAQPVLDRVFFAGEATSTVEPSTVSGAMTSAARVASELSGVARPGERVTVVGAGIAGAETARLLLLAGFDVVVIEASKTTGGRIRTVDTKDWPTPAELGAWRLRPDVDQNVLERLTRVGVSTVDLAATEYRTPTGTSAANAAGSTAVAKAVAWAEGQVQDVALADALTGSGATTAADAAFLTQYLAQLATIDGASASSLSSWYGTDPHQVLGTAAVTGPFEKLVDNALEGVRTVLSTAVTGITYQDSGVSLRLGTGESLATDRVVVTVPLGVLKSDGIRFDPLLPFDHRAAIAGIGVGTVDTVWLRFDKKFWASEAAIWNLVGTQTPISTWFNLTPATGDAVLVGVVGGDVAAKLAKLSDDELLQIARTSLEPFVA